MVKHQIVFIKNMVTMGAVHLHNPIEPTERQTKELLRDEMVQFTDDEKGKVSGKTSGTNDDMAISLIWAVKWSTDIQLIASKENLFHVPRTAVTRIQERAGKGQTHFEPPKSLQIASQRGKQRHH